MSTNNIALYEEMTKNIFQLSSNMHLISSSVTCMCNLDPIAAKFYTVKLGFIGIYIIFLISALKQKLWVLVRTATSYVLSRNNKKISQIFI